MADISWQMELLDKFERNRRCEIARANEGTREAIRQQVCRCVGHACDGLNPGRICCCPRREESNG